MAFEFDEDIRQEALRRQQRRCAFCGEAITRGRFQAHHVIPKQLGNPESVRHHMIGTIDNCVALCVSDKGNCHAHVHESAKYKDGTVPFPSEYKWSHGGNAVLHRAWQIHLSMLYNEIFDAIQAKYEIEKGN
jgi:hypothetical protein